HMRKPPVTHVASSPVVARTACRFARETAPRSTLTEPPAGSLARPRVPVKRCAEAVAWAAGLPAPVAARAPMPHPPGREHDAEAEDDEVGDLQQSVSAVRRDVEPLLDEIHRCPFSVALSWGPGSQLTPCRAV